MSGMRVRGFTLALFGAFVLAMLLALLLGLQAYRALVDERADTEARRLAYGVLVNTVKANDALDAVSVGSYEGNDVLSFLQRTDDGDFTTRLFVLDGQLMQQYAAADIPLEQAATHELFPTELFSVSYDDGLLVLRTDPVTVSVALRCSQSLSDDEAMAAEAEGGVR